MKKIFKLIFAILTVVFTSQAQNTWTQKSDFGGGVRVGAVGFSIGSKGYMGTGSDGSGNKNDFWEYDPVANAWTQKANYGGTARQYAVGFSIGLNGYIGTGNDGSNKNDFWEYDPVLNTWIQKSNFGGTARQYAVGFSISGKGYIGTGSDGTNRKDFWEYDPDADSWTQKADFGGTARKSATGFSIGSKGYMGTGNDGMIGTPYKKDFWEYDPSTNTCVQKASFGGSARQSAIGFSINGKGYVGTGKDGNFSFPNKKDCWEYDPVTNLWIQKADFGGTARYAAAGFSCDNKGYIGSGNDGDIKNDFWQYAPSCNGIMVYADADGDGYGNQSDALFLADCIVPIGYVYDTTDCNDTDPFIHPFICDASDNNGVDENCDGFIDDGYGAVTYYTDTDGDDFGTGNAFSLCSNPGTGYSTNNTDCNDNNVAVHPGTVDVINGIDDNCDGIVDIDFWTQKTDFGGTARIGAAGFSIGSKVYIGTGYDDYDIYNCCDARKDFWEYDAELNVWTQKASFGGDSRDGAVGFSIGNKGYLGTGIATDWPYFSFVNDFWEYDPVLNAWTEKADFGGTGRYAAVGFSIGNKGYIGTGNDGGSKNDFWEYDPATNTWTQKADFTGGERSYAVGFSISNKGYIGTGLSISGPTKDFWEYDPVLNTWTQKTDFGGSARYDAVGFSIGSKGYLGTGEDGSYTKDFWEYYPSLNTWIKKADFGGTARGNAVGFCINSKGYLGTGSDDLYGDRKDFWEYTPDVCVVGLTVYADADGDGFGSISDTYFATDCVAPAGYAKDSTDCNDAVGSIYPGATETCNNLDDNCNALADEGLTFVTYFADADGDGYGDLFYAADTLCYNPGAGFATNNLDCDDTNSSVNPLAPEICNNVDDDCNAIADDGLTFTTYYTDSDVDGYGNVLAPGNSFCNDPGAGYSTNNLDCNDANASVNPSATEICNNTDDDCNLITDDGLIFSTYYADADNDSFGNPNTTIDWCALPAGFTSDSTDCNDANANVNPDATEILFNGIDDDCDGYVDEFGTDVFSSANTPSDFSLFPNPTNDEFVVYLQFHNDLNDEATIQVINLLGHVVYNKTSALLKGKLQSAIRLDDAADGIYLVRVMVNDEVFSRQIVFEK